MRPALLGGSCSAAALQRCLFVFSSRHRRPLKTSLVCRQVVSQPPLPILQCTLSDCVAIQWFSVGVHTNRVGSTRFGTIQCSNPMTISNCHLFQINRDSSHQHAQHTRFVIMHAMQISLFHVSAVHNSKHITQRLVSKLV